MEDVPNAQVKAVIYMESPVSNDPCIEHYMGSNMKYDLTCRTPLLDSLLTKARQFYIHAKRDVDNGTRVKITMPVNVIKAIENDPSFEPIIPSPDLQRPKLPTTRMERKNSISKEMKEVIDYHDIWSTAPCEQVEYAIAVRAAKQYEHALNIWPPRWASDDNKTRNEIRNRRIELVKTKLKGAAKRLNYDNKCLLSEEHPCTREIIDEMINSEIEWDDE